MKIYLGADHAGFKLKEAVKKFLAEQREKYELVDCGAATYDEQDDYPDFITPVAEAVAKDSESRGIVIGGSGQGEAMCANRIHGVRAAVYYGDSSSVGTQNDKNKIITLSREHNNANVLSLVARFVSEADAVRAVQLWLETPFSGEERHQRRIAKFN